MKHVSILLPVGDTVVETITAPYGLLRMANAYAKKSKGLSHDLFNIDLVGVSHEPVTYNGLFQITPTRTIGEIGSTDLVIVTAISGDLENEIEKNRALVDWIRAQRVEHDAEIASLCKGALLVAETGLLNGKECATHWTAHDVFVRRYPKVTLIPEKIICEDNGMYSSGGAYSFLNFVLYLIEKYCGREVAIWCSKVSEVDLDREDQSHFMIFNGQKNHDDEPIKRAQFFIEEHYQERLSVDDLADRVAVSSRNFLRRFKKATANTPQEYIQRVKVEAAKKSLESSTKSINEVMYDVGYNDSKSFRNTFKRYTGLSPLDYRKKYNREMAYAL